ncbi:MAG: hypothetical protein ABIT05_02905 [Chitinophagaceae bacterium]
MNRFFIPGSLFILFFSFSCSNNREPEHTRDIDPSAIYFDYQVRGEEGNELVTVLLQFRVQESFGGTLALDPPSRIEFDGESILADSSRMTGTFYEVQRPATQLAGTHSIVFTDANKKKYKEEFSFRTVALLTQVPDTLHRNQLVFDFDGLEPVDAIRVVIADTTYPGEETDQLDSTKNGRLIIKKEESDCLANGPVQVLFIREYETPVKNSPPKGGGRISFSYTIKREFLLID